MSANSTPKKCIRLLVLYYKSSHYDTDQLIKLEQTNIPGKQTRELRNTHIYMKMHSQSDWSSVGKGGLNFNKWAWKTIHMGKDLDSSHILYLNLNSS